jgi:hypothetical protein
VLPVPSVTTCPISTVYRSSGTGIGIIRGLFGALTNLFTCTTFDLLTGTYRTLTAQNAGGNLVRMGTVLIKLQPDNTLLVDVNVDVGYDLVSVGVSGNCNLLGLTISSCPLVALSACARLSPDCLKPLQARYWIFPSLWVSLVGLASCSLRFRLWWGI